MIELYTRPNCPHCTKAKTILKSVGAHFQEYVVDVTVTKEKLLEMYPGVKTLPVVVINGEYIGGYLQLEQRLNEDRENIGKTFLAG
jgi:glutaredoxin 3